MKNILFEFHLKTNFLNSESMKEETKLMLEALQGSGNASCRAIAQRILSGKSTIDQEKKYTGDFMTSVLEGDFEDAFRRADYDNSIVLTPVIAKLKFKSNGND